jgi:hypothetical protein
MSSGRRSGTSEPLHSVNSDNDLLRSSSNSNNIMSNNNDDDAVPAGTRAVMPPVLPFAILVASFAIVLAVLGSLSAFVGGCLSTPEVCLAAAVAATHANVSVAAPTDSIRVRAADAPAFWPEFLMQQNLLGAKKLFVRLNSNSSNSDGVGASNVSFNVLHDALWITGAQDLGRFSRIGFECECARAVRGTLGSALISIAISANGSAQASIFKNASTLAPAPIVSTDALHDDWSLPASTSLEALPTAVFAPSLDSALVFLDLVTQAKEDNEPQFNRSAIAVGDLRAPPLKFAQLNASYALRPSLVTQRAGATANDSSPLYFFVRRVADTANCSTACYTVARSPSRAALLSHDPEIEYIAAVDANNASAVQWTADALKAVAPVGYDCEVTDVANGYGLCLGYSVWNSTTNTSSNAVQLLQLTEPWFGKTLVPALLVSAPATNNTFISSTFHSETASVNGTVHTVGFSTVANDASGSPLSAFWLLETK